MKKIKNSFGGVIGGIIMIIAGTILLWWNEGNNVKNIKTVAEVEKVVIDVKSDTVDPANEGKLIATNGPLKIEGELTDTMFNVTVNSAKLSRVLEYYQWEENCTTDDDGDETCTYSKGWYDHTIDSSSFKESSKHNNTIVVSFEPEDFINYNVSVGAFTLTKKQVSMMDTKSTYTLSSSNEIDGYHLEGNYITNSKNLSSPEIGDIRVSFKYNDWKDISVLAKQIGNSFEDYTSEVGKTVNRVEEGILSSTTMLEHMTAENNALKWILRAAGALLVIFGYLALINPLSTIASFVPILGNLVGAALGLVAFLVGLVHALIVVAIAWFRFRPLLSVVLIVIAVVLVILLKKFTKGKKAEAQPAQTE